jgi:hypothetical protein
MKEVIGHLRLFCRFETNNFNMKKITLFFVALICFATTLKTQAQTADEIINKYIEASGGKAKMDAIKTRKMSISVQAQGMEILITAYQMRPNFYRSETNLQGKTAIQTYNGTEGWSLDPFSGRETVEQISADDLKSMKEQALFDGPLVDYKANGYKVEKDADEDVDGAPAFHLKVTSPSNDVTHYYFDKETFYLVKQKTKVKMQDGSENESEMYFSNFKEQNGIMMPFTLETRQNYMGQNYSQFLKVTAIEFNISIAPEFFGKPEVKK